MSETHESGTKARKTDARSEQDSATRSASGWLARAQAEIGTFLRPGPRMVDEIECVASVLLAIVFGHLFGAHNISWAAFSGYMVMRGHVVDSFRRGLLRVVGTVTGALAGVAFLELVGPSRPVSALALALIGGTSLFAALTTKRSYAWLFVGLTFAMVVLDKIELSAESSLWHFAGARMFEVFAGTLACVTVSMLSTLSLRRRWPGPERPDPKAAGWRPEAARHAIQGALALALLPLIGFFHPLPELGQAAVSIMAVMMVPIGGLGASGFWPVTRRIVLRIVGCACGAALGAAFLSVSHGSSTILLLGAIVGVMLGRHIENGTSSLTYAGTQFTLAVLVSLVPDSYSSPDLQAGWLRLLGIVIGIVLLEPVLLAWHLLVPRSLRTRTAAPHHEVGEI